MNTQVYIVVRDGRVENVYSMNENIDIIVCDLDDDCSESYNETKNFVKDIMTTTKEVY